MLCFGFCCVSGLIQFCFDWVVGTCVLGVGMSVSVGG